MKQDTNSTRDYTEFLNYFVVIERANGRKAIGILKEILPDGKLKVVGDYNNLIIDTSTIIDFSARLDKKSSDVK